ncbi:hypothetical protein PFISCL1PPCAC_5518, partial [Pristionchus fissidentatus]
SAAAAAAAAALPPTSQPLALMPPTTTAAQIAAVYAAVNQPQISMLNGGRSMSLSGLSPIGIRQPPSMLGQPGPAHSVAAAAIHRPPLQQQTPQKVVGQRGRPRGSGYQRKASMGGGGTANAEMQRIKMQLQQQHQQHLQQQKQQQQQQAYTVPQPAPMGGGMIGLGSSNLLANFGLGPSTSSTPQVTLSSLLAASAAPPSNPQPVQQVPPPVQQLQPDFLAQFLMQPEGAALFAQMQFNAAAAAAPAASSSGLATPLGAATPTNGLQIASLPSTPSTPSMDMLSMLSKMPSTALIGENNGVFDLQQHQQQFLAAAAAPVATPPVVPTAAAGEEPNPLLHSSTISVETLKSCLENPSLIPAGFTTQDILNYLATMPPP